MSTKPEKPIIFAPETYQYTKGHLTEDEVQRDPIEQFHSWFEEARTSLPEGSPIIPESTTFSTARLPSGRVSLRVVLLKELDHSGFVVYSNWDNSKKAQDFNTNKWGSLAFFWPHQQRQVRVEGIMEKVSREMSQRYYNTRPRGSKIGAWLSPQSQPIAGKDELTRRYQHYEEQFKHLKDDEIQCPDFWGGVRIVPREIEFWQGGNSRLHDRITFTRDSPAAPWEQHRIAP